MHLAYLAAFTAAAAGCVAGTWKARQVGPPGVRRGLIGLFLTSGLWSGAHVGSFSPRASR